MLLRRARWVWACVGVILGDGALNTQTGRYFRYSDETRILIRMTVWRVSNLWPIKRNEIFDRSPIEILHRHQRFRQNGSTKAGRIRRCATFIIIMYVNYRPECVHNNIMLLNMFTFLSSFMGSGESHRITQSENLLNYNIIYYHFFIIILLHFIYMRLSYVSSKILQCIEYRTHIVVT